MMMELVLIAVVIRIIGSIIVVDGNLTAVYSKKFGIERNLTARRCKVFLYHGKVHPMI